MNANLISTKQTYEQIEENKLKYLFVLPRLWTSFGGSMMEFDVSVV